MQDEHDKHPVRDSDTKKNQDADSPRQEPVFNGFEDDDGYEEPDRDTDYSSTYRDDDLEEEDFVDFLFEEEQDEGDNQDYIEESSLSPQDDADLFDEPEQDTEAPPYQQSGDDPAEPDLESDWEDEPDYADEELDNEQTWPLGMIVVAVVALLLVIAGGYGVIQQRSATQEEIRQLQAALATSADPAEVAGGREALRQAQQRNEELQGVIDSITLENKRLSDTVAGLESRLATQQEVLATPEPAIVPTGKSPAPPSAPVETEPQVAARPAPLPDATRAAASPEPETETAVEGSSQTVSSGPAWFVNFASYGQRANAEKWLQRLKPSTGQATVTTGTKGDRVFYRVRVVDLPNREVADKVARELAEAHGLPKLWVGRE